MQAVHGKKEFNFFPLTFVLPADLKLLKKTWDDAGSTVKKWIMKPVSTVQ
jgi:tubulin polyglutamylase TTLL4